MITEVEVQNYKSLANLSLPLGRVNVLIGENGSGKSNILEAIALGAAAADSKLDNEFLHSRGIRVTNNPFFMRAAFDPDNVTKEISLSFTDTAGIKYSSSPSNDNEPYSKWRENKSGQIISQKVEDIIREIVNQKRMESGLDSVNGSNGTEEGEWIDIELDRDLQEKIFQLALKDNPVCSYLRNFLIYSPENSILRGSEREGQIQPLGIRGEGLFRFLRFLSLPENKERLDDIKQRLRFLGWFEDFAVSEEFPGNDVRLDIQDRYISKQVGPFDHLSTNEGFLVILFYFCLVAGPKTPPFFAIDNVDTSLNPKLCTRLMKELVSLAKKYEKQLIITTHNPAILDGLNLDDDEQRLFIVRRNKVGQTTVKRFLKPKTEEGVEPVRLSEAFLRGYIGGLPLNF